MLFVARTGPSPGPSGIRGEQFLAPTSTQQQASPARAAYTAWGGGVLRLVKNSYA